MLTAEPIIDPSEYDLNRVLCDLSQIRELNRQRHEMEWLDAIVLEDRQRQLCVGYKDIAADGFWTRGHFPAAAILPNMFICEAAAQLCSHYAQRTNVAGSTIVGLGGMDQIEFGEPVRPGSRLVLLGKVSRLRAGVLLLWQFQALVGTTVVAQGIIKGVPLPDDWFAKGGRAFSASPV